MSNKAVVIYKSQYGATQKYAHWLAEAFACEACSTASAKGKNLGEYETIIYGGGLYAGGIDGVAALKKRWEQVKDKRVIVFTVGLADPAVTGYQEIIDKNLDKGQQAHIKFFHLRGGMDYKALGFVHKAMMGMFVSMLKKKNASEISAEDKLMIETYGKAVDFTDKSSIKPIVDCVGKDNI